MSRTDTMRAGVWLIILGVVGGWSVITHADVGRRLPDEGQEHISTGSRATYRYSPPASGPHWPQWARWGVYEQEIPEELWVHNLEHGGIVILYRCDSPCSELITQLKEAYATFPKSKHGHVKLVITPYPKLKTRVAILAWTWIDELTSFDRDRLLAFYRAHLDRGPEDVP